MKPATATPPPEGAAFPPVPVRARHDGWTAARQREFIAALERLGLVSAAAASVGMSAKSAYALRARAGAEGFAAAWDMAVEQGLDAACALAIARATEGVLVPVFRGGRQVGERRTHDNRLVIAALRVALSRERDERP